MSDNAIPLLMAGFCFGSFLFVLIPLLAESKYAKNIHKPNPDDWK